MHLQALALLTGVTAAVAAETVTLFLPGFDSQSLEGKVLGSSGARTTYLLNCAASIDEDECGLPSEGITVTQGSSTMNLHYGGDEVTVSENCKYDAKSASCSFSLNEGGISTDSSTIVALTEFPGAFMPVTVTATAAGASATTRASASVSTASSTGGSTLTTSTSTSTNTASTSSSANTEESSTSSAATTSQTESHNAAMPMITGNARWAAGGIAAALALAAI